MMGPTTEAIPNMLPKIPMYTGRFLKGTLDPIMFIAPEKRAAAPAPATARPTINMVEDLAAAHRIEPNSNIRRAVM
jgi:hypothetical protein